MTCNSNVNRILKELKEAINEEYDEDCYLIKNTIRDMGANSDLIRVSKIDLETYSVGWKNCSNYRGFKTLPALFNIGFHIVEIEQDLEEHTIKLFLKRN